MKATLRGGRSLHLAATAITFQPNQAQQLADVTQYAYIAAAHGQRVQLHPPPMLHTVHRDGQQRRIEPWQLQARRRDGWHLAPLRETLRPGARVLVIRNMGLGDVLMITPALHALRSQHQVQVALATYARYLPLVWGLEWLGSVYALGTDYQAARFDAIVDLNWAVEMGTEVQHRPRQDIFAKHLAVTLDRRRPFYCIADTEREYAQQYLSRWQRPIIGIQTHASCPQRTYPAAHIRRLTELLQAEGYTIAFFGEHWEGELPAGVVDLVGAVSLRQAAALLEQMAAMICPDSGLLHLAVAVETPTVGLFGPIPPELRTTGYPHCRALSAGDACAHQPCFDMASGRCQDYRCMQALYPAQVADAVQQLLTNSV